MQATQFSITFTEELSEMLGYLTNIHSATALQATITSPVPLKDSLIDESIEVHLTNVGAIKSYDSRSQKEQRIIGIIPIGSSLVGSKISYSVPEFMYVDINNKYSIPLSQFDIQLIGSDTGDELKFEGGINLTLSFRPKKEMLTY